MVKYLEEWTQAVKQQMNLIKQNRTVESPKLKSSVIPFISCTNIVSYQHYLLHPHQLKPVHWSLLDCKELHRSELTVRLFV